MIKDDTLNVVKTPVYNQFMDLHRINYTPIKIYLRNGIALEGFIKGFDNDVIIIENKEIQMVYKSWIATIMPIKVFKNHALHREEPANR